MKTRLLANIFRHSFGKWNVYTWQQRSTTTLLSAGYLAPPELSGIWGLAQEHLVCGNNDGALAFISQNVNQAFWK